MIKLIHECLCHQTSIWIKRSISIKTRMTRNACVLRILPHDYAYYRVILDPKSNQFYCEVMAKWHWRYRSRSKALHATHPLMLAIICSKYGKNRSRTVDATERTWFSRSRQNDPENIGQVQRSLHATHPLMLMMICAKYVKDASRIVDFFQGECQKVRKNCAKLKF